MARIDDTLPTPSNTPSLLIPENQIPTKVNSYASSNTSSYARISPRIQGRLLALFGAFLTGLNLTGIQYMLKNKFPAPQALLTRYTPSLLFVIILGFSIKYLYKPHNKWYFFAPDMPTFKILSIRAFIHWTSNICLIYSLLYVPVMITISLFYVWTIFAIILSHFFLNETANIRDVFLSLIGFGGAILIIDPTFQSFHSLSNVRIEGIILIICASLFYALNMVILRKKRSTFHWMHTESVAGLWATFVFTPIYILICYGLFETPINELMNFDLSILEWLIFVWISIFAFVAIGMVTRALQLETVVIVSIVLYSEVAFGTVFQFVFLRDRTNFDTYGLWIGLVCVLVSTFVIMCRRNNFKSKVGENGLCKLENNELYLNGKEEENDSDELKNDRNERLNLINHAQISKRERYGATDKA